MTYVIDDVLAELATHVQQLLKIAQKPSLEPANPKFNADFALPCFKFARQLGKSPQDIATELARTLQHPALAKAESAGGFVNLWLSDQTIANALQQVAELRQTFGAHNNLADKKLVIEVNNPNPFKDLHIGHAYNSIIADTIANLLEADGGEVHRVSYHGDVGLHVGKSMWAILRYLDGDASRLQAIKPDERAAFLSKMYVQGAGAYDEDPLVRQQIETLTKQSFTLSDPVFAQVYNLCKQWSFDYAHTMLGRLGCTPSEREYMEREADVLGRQAVEAHIGDVFERSDGAVIFKGEKYGLHTRVFITSHDTTLYEARDLGLMQLKYNEYQPDTSYIATAEEQRDYFNVVLKAAELVLPEIAGKTVNIAHGTVKLSTGKMSSRTGQVVNIEWLFDVLDKAIRERSESDQRVDTSIVGALRYAMLKVRVGGDIVLNAQESVSLEGNSGPYLQYAYVRGRSILSKLLDTNFQDATLKTLQPDERLLAIKLLAYPAITATAIAELAPHHICSYLYELTQQFNRFYEHNRIVGDPRQATRAVLAQAYCQVLANGLGLLHIPAPERL